MEDAMGQLVISDVDDGLIDQLHRYAALHQYPMEEMLREILAKAISGKIMKTASGIDAPTCAEKRGLPSQFNSRVHESGNELPSFPQANYRWLLTELERCRALTPGRLRQSS
ncbi:MAG: hypothetical protein HQL94_09740, partial [Magnetococcales bacterium]|nr:hypothetical protein [Magnetococcales bacterium]